MNYFFKSGTFSKCWILLEDINFCESFIVSEHIPTGEHDCVWFSCLKLLFLFFCQAIINVFIHNSCTSNVTKFSAGHTF